MSNSMCSYRLASPESGGQLADRHRPPNRTVSPGAGSQVPSFWWRTSVRRYSAMDSSYHGSPVLSLGGHLRVPRIADEPSELLIGEQQEQCAAPVVLLA